MNTPNPSEQQPQGWVPTNSTLAGGGLGLASSQIILAIWKQVFHGDVDPETAASLAVVCTAAIGYFFPDGGRRRSNKP